MLSLNYWEKAAAFHGHTCPGLAIGFKAAEGAIAELGLDDTQLPAIDEELVCVTENDACCVDAIQCLLGCTYGKANLIPRLQRQDGVHLASCVMRTAVQPKRFGSS